jgi:hypothetical protein
MSTEPILSATLQAEVAAFCAAEGRRPIDVLEDAIERAIALKKAESPQVKADVEDDVMEHSVADAVALWLDERGEKIAEGYHYIDFRSPDARPRPGERAPSPTALAPGPRPDTTTYPGGAA